MCAFWIRDVITNSVNLILNLGLSLHERLFLTLHASFGGREIEQQINEKAKQKSLNVSKTVKYITSVVQFNVVIQEIKKINTENARFNLSWCLVY